MSTANSNPGSNSNVGEAMGTASVSGSAVLDRRSLGLLVHIAAMSSDQLAVLLTKLSQLFPENELLVATPDSPASDSYPSLKIVQSSDTHSSWTLTAADFVDAYQLAQKYDAKSVVMLGPESSSLSESGLLELAKGALDGSVDLVMPHYDLPPNAGLVNTSILYPLTRALFAQRARYPLAVDLALSLRLAERLAAAGQRFTSLNQSNAIIWPVDEAAVAGFTVEEVGVGTRDVPQPTEADLNSILAVVAGSLFADVDTKAAYWQRVRTLPPPRPSSPRPQTAEPAMDIAPMIDSFRLAYTNLREIWSLVLPPNSLLGLKRLSVADGSAFRMPESLWARIVFDFLLAYRLRTINRGHLLGALTPLYLAWVASHISITASGTSPEDHIEAVAAAFEADRPYLVSRWRWPDRFNP